jgi:transposase InsO family protein
MPKLAIDHFNPKVHSIEDWLEQFELHVDIGVIDAAKVKPMLLTHVVPEVYTLLKTINAPTELKDAKITAKSLAAQLLTQYQVITNPYAALDEFHHIRQGPTEDLTSYINSLRSTALNCKFGAGLDARLREQFVIGMADVEMKIKIFEDAALDTFEKMAAAALNREKLLQQMRAMSISSQRPQETIGAIQANSSTPARFGNQTQPTGARPASNNANQRQGNGPRPAYHNANQAPNSGQQQKKSSCFRCGKDHPQQECRFISATCFHCGKIGHIKSICRSFARGDSPAPKTQIRNIEAQEGQQQQSGGPWTGPQENQVEEASNNQYNHQTDGRSLYTIKLVTQRKAHTPILRVPVLINKRRAVMDLDTGAAESVISSNTYRQLGLNPALIRSTNTLLRSYSGNTIPTEGVAEVTVEYQREKATVQLFVVKSDTESLFGMSWLVALGMERVLAGVARLADISQITSIDPQSLLNTYEELFSQPEPHHTMKTPPVTLHIKPDAIPRYNKSRTIPIALQNSFHEEILHLQDCGIISKVPYSQWASAVVIVTKPGGKLRLCGDYKATCNPALEKVEYALPIVQDIFAKLCGSCVFSTLDLAAAYNQVAIAPESRCLTTISTPMGLFEYSVLPFGVCTAPSIFQQVIDTVLQGLPRTYGYLDDIIIGGTSEQDHWDNLNLVLERLLSFGIKLNRNKCTFLQSEVEYLGHRISGEGIKPCPSKVQAIKNAPAPKDQKALRGFTGLLNYYGSFIPNLSSILAPLYELLKKGKEWRWSAVEENAFQQAKEALMDNTCLCHYNPNLPLTVTSDASSVGIGAILAHRLPDGKERPIMFASRKLNPAEKGYSQIEKEGLGLVYALRKFHNFVFGRRFTLRTDHRPLLSIFDPEKNIPKHAVSRLNRWALLLAEYNYQIEFVSTNQMAADFLSRHPTQEAEIEPNDVDKTINAIHQQNLDLLPLDTLTLERATRNDAVLSKVIHFLQTGWPSAAQLEGADLKQFHTIREGLQEKRGIVMYGARVVIPKELRPAILEELHRCHQGMVRTKANARQYVFWNNINEDIEEMIRQCQSCQEWAHSTPETIVTPTHWPKEPWVQLNIDLAGPMNGRWILVVVDQSSKWVEALPLAQPDSASIIGSLRHIFASFGLPQCILSDNASYFQSADFTRFCKGNGIRHTASTPYHPRTNGLAERAIQSLKQALKKMDKSEPLWDNISRYLLEQHTTPHTTTGVAPAEVMFKRRLRTRLDNLIPRTEDHVIKRQEQIQGGRPIPQFAQNQRVFVREFPRRAGAANYIPGVILEQTATYTFRVQLEDGSIVYRHADFIKPSYDISLQVTQPWQVITRPPTTIPPELPSQARSEMATPTHYWPQLSAIPEQVSSSSFREESMRDSTAHESARLMLPNATSTPQRQQTATPPHQASPGGRGGGAPRSIRPGGTVDLDISPTGPKKTSQTKLTTAPKVNHPMQRRSQVNSPNTSSESIRKVHQINFMSPGSVLGSMGGAIMCVSSRTGSSERGRKPYGVRTAINLARNKRSVDPAGTQGPPVGWSTASVGSQKPTAQSGGPSGPGPQQPLCRASSSTLVLVDSSPQVTKGDQEVEKGSCGGGRRQAGIAAGEGSSKPREEKQRYNRGSKPPWQAHPNVPPRKPPREAPLCNQPCKPPGVAQPRSPWEVFEWEGGV